MLEHQRIRKKYSELTGWKLVRRIQEAVARKLDICPIEHLSKATKKGHGRCCFRPAGTGKAYQLRLP